MAINLNRRDFFRTGGAFAGSLAAAASFPLTKADSRSIIDSNGTPRFPFLEHGDGSPSDERFWGSIQQSFNVDRSLIHLNSGGVCPAPEFVQRSEVAHLLDSNRRPFYAYHGEIAPQLEQVRQSVAEEFGVAAEEIALTRNTSEGMEIVQLGIELKRGDEILTTSHDYPRMMQTWRQRAAREGIVIRTVDVPVPLDDPEAFVKTMDAALTPRTRLVMCCHIVDLTGQVLPVRRLADMAHRHGIPILVDGAQSFGQFDFKQSDLECDFFATSLHKWMMGPQGTGMLYVKKERIGSIWPMMPPVAGLENDIRKFEDVGTQAPARFLALGEAITFHRSIGAARKSARLRYLRDYWLDGVKHHGRIRSLTHLPDAHALATISVDGIDPLELRNFLWQDHRIRVRPIDESGVSGIRVSPGMHTTLSELDRFVDVLNLALRNGLPG